MNRIKSLLIGIFVSGLMVLSSATMFGQTVEPSYEVSLQLLIGSNEAGQKGNIPSNLSTVSQRLKSSFGYSNYRLAETSFGRIANTGEFQYRGGSNIGQEIVSQPQSFLEWTINGLKSGQTAKGGQAFHVQSVRIGARVPVRTGIAKDDAGKERSIINYEQIGLTFVKVGLPENVPTLIGTLNLPGANDTIFLVMTVKSVDL